MGVGEEEGSEIMRIANISVEYFASHTGTPTPINYKFVCWVGDVNEKELIERVEKEGREFIQVEIPSDKDV